MVAYILFRSLEQIRHHLLSEPNGFILKADINFYSAVFGLINQELALLGEVGHIEFLVENYQDQRKSVIATPLSNLPRVHS